MPVRDIVMVLRRQATAALNAGRLDAAADILDRLEQEDPLAVETRGLRLELLVKSGRENEARTLASQLLELFPDSARIQLLAGRLAYAARDYTKALTHFQESDRLHPHWRSQHQRGRTLTQLGRYAEAEATLLALLPEHEFCRRDLAWLYERMGEVPRALETCTVFLRGYPHDQLARSQLLRLRARSATPEELTEEVESMVELDERVSPDLIPEYCEKLLQTGQAEKARAFLRTHRQELDPHIKMSIAWIAYRLVAYDIAIELFVELYPSNRSDHKLMTALETAADRIGRLEHVIELYGAHTAEDPRLYGRIKRLQRRLGKGR